MWPNEVCEGILGFYLMLASPFVTAGHPTNWFLRQKTARQLVAQSKGTLTRLGKWRKNEGELPWIYQEIEARDLGSRGLRTWYVWWYLWFEWCETYQCENCKKEEIASRRENCGMLACCEICFGQWKLASWIVSPFTGNHTVCKWQISYFEVDVLPRTEGSKIVYKSFIRRDVKIWDKNFNTLQKYLDAFDRAEHPLVQGCNHSSMSCPCGQPRPSNKLEISLRLWGDVCVADLVHMPPSPLASAFDRTEQAYLVAK